MMPTLHLESLAIYDAKLDLHLSRDLINKNYTLRFIQ